MLSGTELDTRFNYHPPTDLQREKYEYLRKQFRFLAQDLNSLVPESRELSLAMTNLEQAQFWANAGIARRG